MDDIQLTKQNSMDVVTQKYRKPDSDDEMDVRKEHPPMAESPHIPKSWMKTPYNQGDDPVEYE